MKKGIFAFFVLLTFVLLAFFSLTVLADETTPYFTYSLDKQSAASGELVKLKINANHTLDTAAGFRMVINYDDAAVSFVRTETSSQIKSGTMVTNNQNNPIVSVYVCNTDKAAAPELSGNIISFVFKVNDDVTQGKTQIGAHIDEVCNYQAKQLDLSFDEDLTLKVLPQKELSAEACLTELEPYTGTLTPQFSPDVFAYSMHVEYDVTSVEFAAAAGEGGTVKINRKTLKKAGTDTAIVATVTSANKKVTSQYLIIVSRAEKPVEAVTASSSVTTKGKKTSSQKSVRTANKVGGKYLSQKPATGETQETSPEITEEEPPKAAQQPLYAGHRDRNIYIIGNQMPTYIIGMLTTALCIMIGVALSFWLKIKPKK